MNDHATISHLQWFVDEQVEEEKVVGEALSLIGRAGSDANAILYLNDKLGEREPRGISAPTMASAVTEGGISPRP